MSPILSLPSADENSPCRDLTGQILKCESYFAFGGFSDVYQGTWTNPLSGVTRTVAVKCLRSVQNDIDAEAARRRINRESRVWHALNHKNILPFIGVCCFGNTQSLVSVLCQSGDAVKYFQSHPGGDRLKAVCGAARGLLYLHSLSPTAVIHGDLKASNVLIDDSGEARLCDFGRTKLVGHRGFTTIFAGAMAYLAPELLEVAGPVDEHDDTPEPKGFVPELSKETDVYGFSMVALEILSGYAPFYYFQPEYVVILKVASGFKPWRNRHKSEAALTDEIWSLLSDCWDHQAERRLDMEAVVHRLTLAQTAHPRIAYRHW